MANKWTKLPASGLQRKSHRLLSKRCWLAGPTRFHSLLFCLQTSCSSPKTAFALRNPNEGDPLDRDMHAEGRSSISTANSNVPDRTCCTCQSMSLGFFRFAHSNFLVPRGLREIFFIDYKKKEFCYTRICYSGSRRKMQQDPSHRYLFSWFD